jgi:hypothetical protein
MPAKFHILSGAAIAGLAATLVVGASPAQAQPRRPSVSVGRISAEKTCTLYQESAGRSALVATPWSIAEASSWRTWLVRDCVQNFATIRSSLQAALASSGKFTVGSSGGRYTVTGAMSQVGGDMGPAPGMPTSPGGYSVSSNQIFASISVTLKDASGRIVYGGLLTKHLETGSNIHTPGLTTTSSQSGEAVYTELQNQVALAVARLVAFHIEPLRVISNDGDEIQLNYGAPLLHLGTVVNAFGPGGKQLHYEVTSAGPDSSTARLKGDGDPSLIAIGSEAAVVEDDAPQARIYERVDLP